MRDPEQFAKFLRSQTPEEIEEGNRHEHDNTTRLHDEFVTSFMNKGSLNNSVSTLSIV